MSAFTIEQYRELINLFGDPDTQLPVRDGIASKGDMVWWHGEYGPSYDSVDSQWSNIRQYPGVYSVNKPKYEQSRVKYIYD